MFGQKTLLPFIAKIQIGEKDKTTAYISLMSTSKQDAARTVRVLLKTDSEFKKVTTKLVDIRLLLQGDREEHQKRKEFEKRQQMKAAKKEAEMQAEIEKLHSVNLKNRTNDTKK